jgi:hypothetical protein
MERDPADFVGQDPSKRIRQQKEVMLLLYGQAINVFPWLRSLLQEKVKLGRPFLTVGDVTALSSDRQQFVRNTLPSLVTIASGEWKCEKNYAQADGGEGNKDNWVRCALCNTPNRWVFYIVNQGNGNRLNVGSDCITYFGIDTGNQTMDQMKRDATRLRREHEVDLQIPGVEQLITSWDDHLVTYPILIPASFERKYRELGKQFKDCFEEYKNDKSHQVVSGLGATVVSLKSLLKEREQLVAQMDLHCQTHGNDKSVVTRAMVTWLEQRGTQESRLAIYWLKEDEGFVTARTAHRIAEPGFMQSLVPILDAKLREVGLRVQGEDAGRQRYVLSTKDQPLIRLVIAHKDLLITLGGAVFGEQEIFDRSEVIQHCTIADHASKTIIQNELASLLRDNGYSEVSLSDRFETIRDQYDEWVLRDNSSGQIVLVQGLSKVLDRYVAGLTVEQFVSTDLRRRRYTEEDFRHLYSDRTRNQ